MIHVALVSAYPTEAEARGQIVAGLQPLTSDTPYLGIWTMPQPLGGRVHAFGDETGERLQAAGWTREDAERLIAEYRAEFEPVHPCRVMDTRHCPAVYDAVCGDDRPCARFESDDETPWVPEARPQGWTQ